MQEIKIVRIWQWAVILLVLCNIALMLTIWLKPIRKTPDGSAARDFIITDLKFSDQQVREYDRLIADHRQAMRQLQQAGMSYRTQLFSCLREPGGSDAVADSLAQLIANDQKQIELVTYHHFQQVRRLCTEAQKAEFDHIIQQVMKMMNGPGHAGMPPHGDRLPDREGGPEQNPPGGQGPPPDDRPHP